MTSPTAPPAAGTRDRPRSPLVVLALALVVGVLVLVAPAPTGASQPGDRAERFGALPVLTFRGFADPTVVAYAGGYVGVSTGPSAPRAVAADLGGPWSDIGSALTTLPAWATSPRIWASDLVRVRGRWVLYFSALVGGLQTGDRCIGAAVAARPTDPFVPQQRPLVCPRPAAAPTAYDTVRRVGTDLPRGGVIDPELVRWKSRNYLTYRTQSTPSTIRAVRLPRSGLAFGEERSEQLLRSDDVIENPTVVKRGDQLVMFTSEGFFGSCGYRTTWRRSTDLLDWSGSRARTLLDTARTGLCGPGGADVLDPPRGASYLWFHAWTCPELGTNCPPGPNYDRDRLYDAQRSLFAARLRWTRYDAPKVARYVTPVLPPAPPPPPPPAEPAPAPEPARTDRGR